MNSLPRPVQCPVGEKLRIVLAPVTMPERIAINPRTYQFIHDRILGLLIENGEFSLKIEEKTEQIVRIGNLPETVGVKGMGIIAFDP